MPTYTIEITEEEMIALRSKFQNPQEELMKMVKEYFNEQIKFLAEENVKTLLKNPSFNGEIPADPMTIVQGMELKSARQRMDEDEIRMKKMIADPDSITDDPF